MIKPTELVYSSHDRCEFLHRHYIVDRALESPFNKSVFYLPLSSGSWGDQHYSAGTFSWYFDRFRAAGLVQHDFYWSDDLRLQDAELFFQRIADCEVVILGGGSTVLGLERYGELGRRFYGDPDRFVRTLRERQAKGMLTVGFSAGADQLCEHACSDPAICYGLVRNVVVRLHFEHGVEGHVAGLAREYSDCLVFGLPNDSGLAVVNGSTPKGASWQLIEFVIDASWDKPEDQWHIRTRQGLRIEHRYRDGRDWQFNGGDLLLRVFSLNGHSEQTWIKPIHEEHWRNYETQEPSAFLSAEDIIQTL